MMKYHFFVLLILLLFSCSGERELQIGLIADLSSGTTTMGVSSRNAIQMAIEEINDRGGIDGRKIVLVSGDNRNDPGKNQQIINDFAERGIKIVIGPFLSRMAPFVLEASSQKDMLIISPAVSSDLFSDLDDNFLRIMPSASQDGIILAQALIERGDKTAALIRNKSNDLYTQWLIKGVRDTLEKAGIDILYDSAFTDVDDLNLIAEDLLELSPEALVFSSLGSDAGKIIQLYGINKKDPRIYCCEWAKNTDIDIHGGKYIQSMITVGIKNQHEDLSLEENFLNNYRTLFSEDPLIFSVFSYEIIFMLDKALEELGRNFTAADLKESLLSLKGFRGILGDMEFNEYGDSKRLKTLYIYRDDRYVAY